MKIIWREFFNEAAVKQLTEMGTLPRYETEMDVDEYTDGEEAAAEIAEKAFREDSEMFREGGTLVIVEPEHLSGTYDIEVEYRPSFYANARD